MAELKKTLVGVLGSITAAVALFTAIPAEESGRKVAVSIDAPTGQATIRHISGPQYLIAYLDVVKVPTICDGLTTGVRMGQVATPLQCTARLEAELVDMATHVIACVPALYGRANQAAAAVSLAYNIGWPSFCKSTVARRFNAGQWIAGCNAFTMWVKAGGRTVAGLVSRQQRERILCLTGLTA